MPAKTMRKASYNVDLVTQAMVIISDHPMIDDPNIFSDPESVVFRVHSGVASLSVRRLFHRNSVGQFHEPFHLGGRFKQFAACSGGRRLYLERRVR